MSKSKKYPEDLSKKSVVDFLMNIPYYSEILKGNNLFGVLLAMLDSMGKYLLENPNFALYADSIKVGMEEQKSKRDEIIQRQTYLISEFVNNFNSEIEELKKKYNEKHDKYKPCNFNFDALKNYVDSYYDNYSDQYDYYKNIYEMYQDYKQESNSIFASHYNLYIHDTTTIADMIISGFYKNMVDDDNPNEKMATMLTLITVPERGFEDRLLDRIKLCDDAKARNITPIGKAKSKVFNINFLSKDEFYYLTMVIEKCKIINANGFFTRISELFTINGEPINNASYKTSRSEIDCKEYPSSVRDAIKRLGNLILEITNLSPKNLSKKGK